MKFENFKIIILIFFFIYDSHVLCNKLKAKANRSLMNFLNGLFSPQNKVKVTDYASFKNQNRGNNDYYNDGESYNNRFRQTDSYRFSQDPKISQENKDPPLEFASRENKNQSIEKTSPSGGKESSNETDKGKDDTTQIKQCEDKTNEINEKEKIIFQGWLMISSSYFLNRRIFPTVRISEGKEIHIHTDEHKFRINDAFFASKGSKSPSAREFWFRLSGLLLYYSASQDDVNILGAISILEIIKIDEIEESFIESIPIFCFYIFDKLEHNWRLCSYKKDISIKWMCSVYKLLGKKSQICGDFTTGIKIIEHTVTQPVIIIPLPSRYCNQDWNYQQMGADWECGCSEGKEQSPIDLPNKLNAIDSAIKPLFSYNNIGADLLDVKNLKDDLTFKKDKIDFVYRDNTLRILYDKLGKLTTTDGSTFQAQEIVFHMPSEHTIEGKRYDMEIQIIHYNAREISKQATLSFLVQKTPGIYNQFFDELNFFSLPNPAFKETELKQIYIPKILYEKTAETDEYNTLPDMKPFSFYTYQGSISFPPCSENTIVYVASKPIKLGSTALTLFQEALRIPDMKNAMGDIITSDWLAISYRKTQERNGRPIFFYDHEKYCGPDVTPLHHDEGHFEKITTTINKYYYVSDEKPSGIPHSFVVSKNEAVGFKPIFEG